MALPALKTIRERKLLSQVDVAEKARVAAETISRIENGRPVRPETARRLALALGVDVDDLRGELVIQTG